MKAKKAVKKRRYKTMDELAAGFEKYKEGKEIIDVSADTFEKAIKKLIKSDSK